MTPLLLFMAMHVAAGLPAERTAAGAGVVKYASWDDVNIVAHGLLQLGQGLKEHVEKTKAQMKDVNAKLKVFNSSVSELGRKQQEQEEALKARKEEVEEKEKLAAELAEEVMVKVEEVKKESENIHSRMQRLEEKMVEVLAEPTVDSNSSDHAGVPLVQSLMEAQNRRIDQLVEKIKQQQDKLEKQSLHLQALQTKVAKKRVKSHQRRDEEMALRGEPEPGNTTSSLARDCHDLFVQAQRPSGVYTIQPENSKPFNVLCQMTPEGGWTFIQQRHDGSQNFNQLWDQYKKGFGNLKGEFWLGLDNIRSISRQGEYILQVEVSDWAGEEHQVQYQFQLDREEMKYTLHLEQVSSVGVLDKSLWTGASGLPFSTSDRDNDLSDDKNCAELLSGGWWFSSCGESNLNGKYRRRPSLCRRRGMFWNSTVGHKPLKSTLMKIAPTTIKQ